jgi:hypothetical protein
MGPSSLRLWYSGPIAGSCDNLSKLRGKAGLRTDRRWSNRGLVTFALMGTVIEASRSSLRRLPRPAFVPALSPRAAPCFPCIFFPFVDPSIRPCGISTTASYSTAQNCSFLNNPVFQFGTRLEASGHLAGRQSVMVVPSPIALLSFTSPAN